MALSLDEQVSLLARQYEIAIRDAESDYGEEVIAAGGWVELARATVDLAPNGVSEPAKAEFLRMQGLA